MTTCIATDCIPGSLPAKLDAIAAAGFAGIALKERDFTCFDGSAEELRARLEALNLTLVLLEPSVPFGAGEGEAPLPDLGWLDRKFDLMQALGAPLLLLSAPIGDAGQDREELVEHLRKAVDRAEARGLRLAIQALPSGGTDLAIGVVQEIAEAIDSPAFGVALNSSGLLAGDARPAVLRSFPGEKIFHVGLSDTLRHPPGAARLLPGQGDLNLEGLVRVLSRIGYSGALSIDGMNTAGLRSGPKQVAADGYRALANLLDEVARNEPGFEPDLPKLPGRVRMLGVEFVEFTCDEASAEALRKMLGCLRFRLERRHIHKSVELWRQGAVNIVLNTEREGFARSAFVTHGPTVCDLGLRVTDARQTARRVNDLGGDTFSQPLGTGELDIPAVRGVGGMLVHFIDEKSDLHRVWDIEFQPVSATEAIQPAGLRRIDHIAQTMRPDEMQSWLLFYLSTFQMKKSPPVEVSDPAGPVSSQAIESPEGEVRMTLNGVEPGATVAGSFIADKFGAGIQHIALATDDIFETSSLLAASGFPRLAIPKNYYADLLAGQGLDAALVARLQDHDILYARSGTGSYFQIYSQPIFGGFFFEIVERQGGYPGFGARNAPVRVAAQSRLLRPAGVPVQ